MTRSPPVRRTHALPFVSALTLLVACDSSTPEPPVPPTAVERFTEHLERARSVLSDVRLFRAPAPVEWQVPASNWSEAGEGLQATVLPWSPLPSQLTVHARNTALEPADTRARLRAEGGYLLTAGEQTWTSEWLQAFLPGPVRKGQGGEPESLFLTDQQPVTLPLEVTGDELHLRLAVFLPREIPVLLTVTLGNGHPLPFRVEQTGWQILEGQATVSPGPLPVRLEVTPLVDRPVPPRLLALARVGVRTNGPDRILVQAPTSRVTIRMQPRVPRPIMNLPLTGESPPEAGLWSLGGVVLLRADPPVPALAINARKVELDEKGEGRVSLSAGLHTVRAPGVRTLTLEQPLARLQPFLLGAGRPDPTEAVTSGSPESVAGLLRTNLSSAGDQRRGFWLPAPTTLELATTVQAGDRIRCSAALLDPPAGGGASHSLTWDEPVAWQPSEASAHGKITWEPEGGEPVTLWEDSLESLGWHDVDWSVEADRVGPGRLILTTSTSEHQRGVAVGVADPRVVRAGAIRPAWNVLLYLVDTLRADGLSSYGADHPTSPVLDRIAAEGYRFSRFQSVASWTRPSAASILTGLYPAYHGILTARNGLSPELSTLAEVFEGAGYSNWAGVANIQVAAPGVQFDQGFHRFLGVRGLDIERPELQLDPSSKRIHDAYLPWLDQYGDEPWFLYLHTMDPHMPYLPPDAVQGRFDPDYDGVLANQPLTDVSVIWQHVETLDARDVAFVRSRYDEEVHYQDQEFGRLWQHLEDSGQLEHTVLVLLSDHGEEFFEHQRFSHQGRMWDELLHVPLILWVPPALRETLGPPRVIEEPLSQVDLLPTLVDLLDLEDSHPRQGRSVVPLLRGEPWDDALLFAQEGDQLGAVLAGPWKLVWHQLPDQERTFELYHRGEDPEERQDLAATRPELVERLWQQRQDWQSRQAERGLAPREGHVATFDLDALQELRALGYIK